MRISVVNVLKPCSPAGPIVSRDHRQPSESIMATGQSHLNQTRRVFAADCADDADCGTTLPIYEIYEIRAIRSKTASKLFGCDSPDHGGSAPLLAQLPDALAGTACAESERVISPCTRYVCLHELSAAYCRGFCGLEQLERCRQRSRFFPRNPCNPRPESGPDNADGLLPSDAMLLANPDPSVLVILRASRLREQTC